MLLMILKVLDLLSEFLNMEEIVQLFDQASLECGWCGDVAIYSKTGFFQEDEGEACISCGFPGHVEIEEDLFCGEEDQSAYTAYWSYNDDKETVIKWVQTHTAI